MGFTLAALTALEALCAARGRPVTVTVGVPFNERVLRALRRLRGDSERSDTMAGWNNEVLRLLGGGSAGTVVEPSVRASTEKTADYVITVADIEAGTTFAGSPSGGSMTFTLPPASGWAGRAVRICNSSSTAGAKTVAVDGDGSETVGGDPSVTLNPGDGHTFESDGSNVLIY